MNVAKVGPSWAATFGAELEALAAFSVPAWIAFVVLVAVGGAAALLVIERLYAQLVRLHISAGVDRRLVDVARVLVWCGAAGVALQPPLTQFPTIAAVVTVAALLTLARVAPGPLEDAIVGVSGLDRGVVTPGRMIRVGEHRGRVERIGLWGVELRAPDGAQLRLPNRRLVREAVAAELAADTHRTRVLIEPHTWPGGAPTDPDRARAELLAAARLCPLRVERGAVSVVSEGAGYLVELESWASEDDGPARLRRWLLASLAPPPAAVEEEGSETDA